MKFLTCLLCISVALAFANAQQTQLPCNCEYSGNPPTSTDTPQQRASVCSAGQAQLSCFQSCSNATQSDLNGISTLLEQFGCGAGSNIISILSILLAVILANVCV